MQNILFVGLESAADIHFATDIELIKENLKKNDRNIYLLKCDKSSCPICFPNIGPNYCDTCEKKFKGGLKITGISDKINIVDVNLSNIELSEGHNQIIDGMRLNNIQDLKNITINDYDVGMATASLLISRLRDPYPEINDSLKDDIHLYIANLCKFTIFLEDAISKLNIEKVYVFNGRFPHYRMALRICQKNQIEVVVHERGYRFNGYSLVEGTYPHDINKIKQLIEEHWNIEERYDIKEQEAVRWYNGRRGLKNKNILSLIKDQQIDNVPRIDKNKKNIGIFVSSEDEYEAIDGWENRIYKNQNDALERMIEYDGWDDDVYFYLRVHPNLKGLDNSQTRFMDKINWERMTVIPAESLVSTYRLIEECDIVITFGSTVGIEVCFMKKPAILAGRAAYEDLGGFFVPKSHQELCRWINTFPNCEYDLQKAYEASVKYAWFTQSWSTGFTQFIQKDFYLVEYIGGSYPHDIDHVKRFIEEVWDEEKDDSIKEQEAVKWYHDRQGGSQKSQPCYIRYQNVNNIPSVDKNKKNIGILLSIEDEHGAINGWKNRIYKNQNDALEKIIEYNQWDDNVHFYLRVHPLLKGVDNSQTEFINKINWARMTVISAESPMSTYRLIEECDVILTFGSNIGMDACFMKKPVILAGVSHYKDLGGFFTPKSHEELCQWVNTFPDYEYDLQKAYEASLKYAWFIQKADFDVNHFIQKDNSL